MKPLSRDISLTLIVKLILLFLLWWFCVRGMHPALSKSHDWFLGGTQESMFSEKNKR